MISGSRLIGDCLLLIMACCLCGGAHGASVPYGNSPEAGHTFVHGGVTLYYETYGHGEPLLLIHGNGASVASFAAQIDYFRPHYLVIAMDSRGHGKSGDDGGALTFESMADDLAALLDHLGVGRAYVLGWSDGAVEALLLGIRHPGNVRMIASMAANLAPGATAIYPEFLELFESSWKQLSGADQTDPRVRRALRVAQLDREGPHIAVSALQGMKVPTLVMAGDHDVIRDEHTLLIYHSLPNSQLVVFPNATHMEPIDDPALFNSTVERFFATPFVRKNRVKDFLESYDKAMAASAN